MFLQVKAESQMLKAKSEKEFPIFAKFYLLALRF